MLLHMVAEMEVDKVADIVADKKKIVFFFLAYMFLHMVAEMEVQMVANIEVDKVADKVADIVADMATDKN